LNNRKLIRPEKRLLQNLLNKYKTLLRAKCKENRLAILLVLTANIILIVFMGIINTREGRVSFGTILLCIDYVLLMMLVIAHSKYLKDLLGLSSTENNNKIIKGIIHFLNWLDKHSIALSIVLAFSALFIFDSIHRISLYHNLTIAFCFALILYRVVLFIKEKSQDNSHTLDLKSQKIYIIYASFIALSFLSSNTVDNSKYGTEFQLTILSWVMLFHLLSHWFIGQWKLVKQLNNERTDAELMHLKSQINPHFLFNTLNNLYGLALEKSDETPGLILKLSDMLRYTIYQGEKDKVLFSEEINYLNDFIQLQQIRYHKPVNITFEHTIDSTGATISPLLLLILVENAYKHGVEKLTEDAFVHIKLEVKDEEMVFDIKNNFDKNEKSVKSGIGLQNLKKRLQLTYPNAYQLNIKSEHSVYCVQLKINLQNENLI